MRDGVETEDQPICHFCIRPQEDVPILFVTEDECEGDEMGTRPNICSECVALVHAVLETRGAEAAAARKAAVRRRRLSVIAQDAKDPG